MIKKTTILLLTLFLGGMITLSCAHQHSNSVFKRDSFLKLEKTLKVLACSDKEQKCMPVNKWGSTASGAVIKNRFDGSYALTAAHVCDDSQMKKFINIDWSKVAFLSTNSAYNIRSSQISAEFTG